MIVCCKLLLLIEAYFLDGISREEEIYEEEEF